MKIFVLFILGIMSASAKIIEMAHQQGGLRVAHTASNIGDAVNGLAMDQMFEQKRLADAKLISETKVLKAARVKEPYEIIGGSHYGSVLFEIVGKDIKKANAFATNVQESGIQFDQYAIAILKVTDGDTEKALALLQVRTENKITGNYAEKLFKLVGKDIEKAKDFAAVATVLGVPVNTHAIQTLEVTDGDTDLAVALLQVRSTYGISDGPYAVNLFKEVERNIMKAILFASGASALGVKIDSNAIRILKSTGGDTAKAIQELKGE